MADREGEKDKEREVEKALHLLLLATPTAPVAYPGAFSDGKLGENFSAGCSWGNFVLLFSTFDDFLPNRCRYNAKCSYMPASQPASQGAHNKYQYKGVHKESLHPQLQKRLSSLACSSHCSFIRRPLTCRQQPSRQAGRQSEVHP